VSGNALPTLLIRPATLADLEGIAHAMYDPPEPPFTAIFGDVQRAGRIGRLLLRHGLEVSLRHTVVVAASGVEVAGMMESGEAHVAPVRPGAVVRLLTAALPVIGPAGVVRALRALWLRRRVSFEPGHDFAVQSLYVAEEMRNRGIGARLLDHAEHVARERGEPRMRIETGTTNPARRLYQRCGYRVVETKTDAEYERLTGSPGRVKMMKELSER
jgi:ribosomal protein S18 acetylase RimI-like enzyme